MSNNSVEPISIRRRIAWTKIIYFSSFYSSPDYEISENLFSRMTGSGFYVNLIFLNEVAANKEKPVRAIVHELFEDVWSGYDEPIIGRCWFQKEI